MGTKRITPPPTWAIRTSPRDTVNYCKNNIPIRLNLDKHLRIKISEKSLTQRFDVSMTSFSNDVMETSKPCVKLFSLKNSISKSKGNGWVSFNLTYPGCQVLDLLKLPE